MGTLSSLPSAGEKEAQTRSFVHSLVEYGCGNTSGRLHEGQCGSVERDDEQPGQEISRRILTYGLRKYAADD